MHIESLEILKEFMEANPEITAEELAERIADKFIETN